MSGRVYAIAGGKGGVGKTTTVANLATALSAAGYDVVGVDVDLGMANLGPVLGVDPDDGATIHDVLAGDAGITAATYRTDRDFSVIPGTQALDEYAEADPSRLKYAVGPLTDEYDIVLLDTSAGLSHEVMVPLGLADSVLLITTPDVVAIRDAAKSGELASRVGGSVEGVSVNRARENEKTQELVDELGDEVLATIPEDSAITMTHVVARTGSPAARAFSNLAAHLVGVDQLEETEGEYAALESASEGTESAVEEVVDEAEDTESESTEEKSSTSGPVTTAAYDEGESESFFSEEREEEERASALGRLRRIFE
jgi:septum site-determining protein MinD